MINSFRIVATFSPLLALGCAGSTVTAPMAPEPSPVSASVAGTYLGMLPCADCEQIRYRLQLNADGSYMSRMTYADKPDRSFDESGRYAVRPDGVVELDKTDEGMKFFKNHAQGLQMLDIHGQEITGGLSGRYILTRMPRDDAPAEPDRSANFLYKLWSEGVDFYARGNEPFWSLDMDFDRQFRFSAMNDMNLSTPPAENLPASDAGTIRFQVKTESAELLVSLSNQPCTDSMSGQRFDYAVDVQVKRPADQNYRQFKGCGDYIPDMRLTDIWIVEQVEGKALPPAWFMKGLPTLELSAKERRLTGHDGCNRIGGSFSTQRHAITFTRLISTRMFCPAPEDVPAIGSLLSEKTYNFEFVGNRLYLKNNGRIILTLKHAD